MKKVSVIIPTYSRPTNLMRAINSVLKQTYRNIEIIVVDDNGINTICQVETENRLRPLIESHKIIYIKHEVNKNGSAARNSGLRICSGDYFTFLDDDDYLYPPKIEKQVEALENRKEFDIVYCGWEKRGDNHASFSRPSGEGNLQMALLKKEWGFGSGSNPLFRRTVYETIGLFDESYQRHQDLEYMVRAFRHFKICPVNEILLIKYINSNSNRPKVDKCSAIKEKFLNDFAADISTYSKHDQNLVYRNNWYEIALLALGEDVQLCWFYVKKAASFTMLTPKQVLKLLYYGILRKQYGR